MAGILAWAADVVAGGAGAIDGEEEKGQLPLVFTQEQQVYASELDGRAASLRRSIEDLRLRIPPPDISQRLPDLHAHSLASNAALALQLDAHSTTRQQTQSREAALLDENAAYEKAIVNCQNKIQEKLQEVELLQIKLKEMNLAEQEVEVELKNALSAKETGQAEDSNDDSKRIEDIQFVTVPLQSFKVEDLHERKKELSLMEEMVQRLESDWLSVQQESSRKPTSAQREKLLEKQLHSVIEQLTSKQAQAEGLITEIHAKEKELERLNALKAKVESGNIDTNVARNRVTRNITRSVTNISDYTLETYGRANHSGSKAESLQRLSLLSYLTDFLLPRHMLMRTTPGHWSWEVGPTSWTISLVCMHKHVLKQGGEYLDTRKDELECILFGETRSDQ